MVTLLFFWIFLAFLALYNSSGKMPSSGKSAAEQWFKSHRVLGKKTALVFLAAALVFGLSTMGIGVGSLVFCIMLTAAGSLVVLFAPLRIFRPIGLSALFTLGLLFEIFLQN